MEYTSKKTISFELDEDEARDFIELVMCWNEHGSTEDHPDTTRLAIGMLNVLTQFFS